jgi:hypothetical protein
MGSSILWHEDLSVGERKNPGCSSYMDKTFSHLSVICMFGFSTAARLRFDRSCMHCFRVALHCSFTIGGTCPIGYGDIAGVDNPRNGGKGLTGPYCIPPGIGGAFDLLKKPIAMESGRVF